MVSNVKTLALLCLLSAAAWGQVLQPHNGGTGSNSVPSSGQIPIGTGTHYVPKTVSGDASLNSAGLLTILGIESVPFCSGYTPTNGQVIEYTTASSPNPCYTAATVSGGGSMVWPSGGAGVPNYNGSSAWGTSYSASNTFPANFIPTLNQSTSGNAATATALAALPTPCSSGQAPTGILANGNSTGCTTYAQTGVDINSSFQVTATHLALALPVAQGGLGVSASSVAAHNVFGNNTGSSAPGAFVHLACGDLSDAGAGCTGSGGGMVWPAGGAGIPNYSGSSTWGTSYSASNTIPANFIPTLNQSTSGNAATATALAALPTPCSAGQAPVGILANGDSTGCAPIGGPSTPQAGVFLASQNCTTPGTYDETCANNASRAATAIGGGQVLIDVPNGATGPTTYTFSHDAYTNACGITSWSTSGTTLTVHYATTGSCTVKNGNLILISGTTTGGGGHTIDNGASGNPSTWTIATSSSGLFTASSTIASDSAGAGGVVDTKQPVVWYWQTGVTVTIAHSDGAGHFGICYGEGNWLFGQKPGLSPANTSFKAADFKTSSADVDAIIRPCNQRGLQQGGGYKNFYATLDGSSSRFRLGAAFPTTEAFTGSEMGNMIVDGGVGAANNNVPTSQYSFSSGTSGVNTTAVVVVDSLNGNAHAQGPVTAIVGGSSSGPTDILIKSLDEEHTRATSWTGVAAALSGGNITFTVTAPNYAYPGVMLVVTACADTHYNLTWSGNAPTGATGGVISATSTTIVVGSPTGFAGAASTSGCTVEIDPPIFLADGGGGASNSVSTLAGINIGRGYFEAETGSFFSRIGQLVRNGAHDSNFSNFRFAGGNHFLYDILVEGPQAPVGLQWHNVFCHLSDLWIYTDWTKTPQQQVPCSPYPHANEFYTSDGNYFQSTMLFGRNTGPTSSMSAGIAMEWSKANDASTAYRTHLLLNNNGVDYQTALEKATDAHTAGNFAVYDTGGVLKASSVPADTTIDKHVANVTTTGTTTTTVSNSWITSSSSCFSVATNSTAAGMTNLSFSSYAAGSVTFNHDSTSGGTFAIHCSGS